MKETMIQYFDWYSRNDGWHWNRLKKEAKQLKNIGITSVWMPPAYKGCGGKNDVGYGVYDMYDLGEFDQKGSVRTKYGTKEQYLAAIEALHQNGIKAIGDIVFNHRMGADGLEWTEARTLDPSDRTKVVEDEHEVQVWTNFWFPGRGDKYSDFHWNWTCFTGTDYDVASGKAGILEFKGKTFDPYVSKELGNFDYIMGCDVDFRCHWVLQELQNWGHWYVWETGIDGFRLDAIKSIDSRFFYQWISRMKDNMKTDPEKVFSVGEYWSGNISELEKYLEECQHCMSLFDVPLHFRFFDVSKSNGNYDIRKVFYNTLTEKQPDYAVAFVDNHDTQPTQALESWVEDWFKVSAYATILLKDCKNPCVFYGDWRGIPRSKIKPVPFLKEFVWIRSHLLSDTIVDCFDEDYQKACWAAPGENPVVVIYSIGEGKEKGLCFPEMAGMELVDVTNPEKNVTIGEDGCFTVSCDAGSCSVYIKKEDYKKMRKEIRWKKSR